jgi:hypothetical protein
MAVNRRPIEGLSDPAVEHHLDVSRLRGVTTPDAGDAERGVLADPVYGAMSARARARNQTTGQRKKAERDRQRNKVTFDLPEAQTSFIEQVARQHQCPPSHVAALLLEYAIEHWARIDIEGRKVRTRNLRFEWFLDV